MSSVPRGLGRYEVAGCIDIWSVELEGVEFAADRGWESLSADEQSRAQRFTQAAAAALFVRGRAALREILASYLGGHPRAVPLTYGPYGKPALDPSRTASELQFNVSHSGAHALVAVTSGRSVGIDIERIRTDFDIAAIVERFFSRSEQRRFAALPSASWPAAFYHAWTCKEAYLKALGTGIHLALDEFDVRVDPRRPARLLRPHAEASEGHALHALRVPAGYAGAVAIAHAPAPSATSTRLRAAGYP